MKLEKLIKGIKKVDVTIRDETDIGKDGTCLARTLQTADKAMYIISAPTPQSNLE